MGREYMAFWVFEEEAPNELKKHKTKETIIDRPIVSFYRYEGSIVIDGDGINMRGRSIKTGEAFKAYIPFSNILKMEKNNPVSGGRKEKISDRILKIVYQEKGKKELVYIQEKLLEMNEEEEEEIY